MKFYCVGDEETVRGFRLAGVTGYGVASASEAEQALSAIVALGDGGILILTQTLSLQIPEAVQRLRFAAKPPLLVEVPGPEGRAPGHRSLQQRMQEAVGIRVDGEAS